MTRASLVRWGGTAAQRLWLAGAGLQAVVPQPEEVTGFDQQQAEARVDGLPARSMVLGALPEALAALGALRNRAPWVEPPRVRQPVLWSWPQVPRGALVSRSALQPVL